MTTHALPPSLCCACGELNVVSASASKPGDYRLCIHCGKVNALDENLMLRSPISSKWAAALDGWLARSATLPEDEWITVDLGAAPLPVSKTCTQTP